MPVKNQIFAGREPENLAQLKYIGVNGDTLF